MYKPVKEVSLFASLLSYRCDMEHLGYRNLRSDIKLPYQKLISRHVPISLIVSSALVACSQQERGEKLGLLLYVFRKA